MRKADKYFSVSFYRYAPESLKAFWNNQRIELTDEERSRIGMAACTGNYQTAIKELKKVVRAFERKETERVTYGYRMENNSDKFAFTRQITARADNLRDRLSAYKEIKRYFKSRDWTFENFAVTSGNFNPFGKSTAEETKAITERVNPNKPIKIHFHGYSIYR